MRLFFALMLVTAISPGYAHADDRPVCTEPPSDAEVVARLGVLSGYIRHEEPLVRRWFTSFALLHGVMASASAMFATQADSDTSFRDEMLVNMTSSTLALASLIFTQPPLIGSGGTLDSMSEHTPEARLLKLRLAEDILLRAHDAVELAHGWFSPTSSSIYVVGAATTLLVGLDRVNAAYTHSAGGVILGLGRLLLRPRGARTAWRRYRRVHADAGCEEAVAQGPQTSWRLVPAGIGLGIRVQF